MPSPRAHPASSARTRVRRLPERGRYDRDAIDAVLDAGLVAHLGFVVGRPAVRDPDAPRAGRRGGLRPRLVGEPDAAGARGRHRRLSHGDAARRHRPRALGVRALDELPLGRRPRDGIAGGGAGREARGARGVHREAPARAAGRRRGRPRRPSSRRRRCCACRSTRRRRRSATAAPRTATRPTPSSTSGPATCPLVVTALDPVPDPSLRPGIPVPPALRPYRRPGLVE